MSISLRAALQSVGEGKHRVATVYPVVRIHPVGTGSRGRGQRQKNMDESIMQIYDETR